jgi:thiamine transport system substrate-binding protein
MTLGGERLGDRLLHNFSGSSGQGPQPMVVSYGSSPVAEVFFAETPPLMKPPTGSIVGPNTCYRQIEFVGILKERSSAKWRKVCRFYAEHHLPGGYAAADVRLPGQPAMRSCRRFVQHAQIPESAG